jgi:uncharacterized membrane protein YbhN (UPF0104 family)
MYLLPGANLIGALLVFRFVYFLLPLGIGLVVFAVTELLLRRGKSGEAALQGRSTQAV